MSEETITPSSLSPRPLLSTDREIIGGNTSLFRNKDEFSFGHVVFEVLWDILIEIFRVHMFKV